MRLPAWFRLALAVLLLGFEVSLLAIGLFGAQVSPAYRAYFIERSTDRWNGATPQPPGRTSR